jgi:hypothetical protein
MAEFIDPNFVREVPIDQTGEIGTFLVRRSDTANVEDVGVYIDGTDTASYAVDVGENENNAVKYWFEDQHTYDSTDKVSDMFTMPARFLRVRVTTAASTSGATAKLLIACQE